MTIPKNEDTEKQMEKNVLSYIWKGLIYVITPSH